MKELTKTAAKILGTVSFMDLLLNNKYKGKPIKDPHTKICAFVATLGLAITDLSKVLQTKIHEALQDPMRKGDKKDDQQDKKDKKGDKKEDKKGDKKEDKKEDKKDKKANKNDLFGDGDQKGKKRKQK